MTILYREIISNTNPISRSLSLSVANCHSMRMLLGDGAKLKLAKSTLHSVTVNIKMQCYASTGGFKHSIDRKTEREIDRERER